MNKTTKSKRLAIIPAAGFGTRVGSPQSKEMLINSQTGSPMINFAIDLALEACSEVLVITRKEKINLINHLQLHYPMVKLLFIDPTKEWTHSVYESRRFWNDENIIILPDSSFTPTSIINSLLCKLSLDSDLSFATFEVDDFKTWGVVACDSQNQLWIGEKPRSIGSTITRFFAWGVVAFKGSVGEHFWRSMMQSSETNQLLEIGLEYSFIPLDSFEDLTR